MNRTFKQYYKEAHLASKKAFKDKENLIKYYSYFFPTLVLRIVLFILYPIFRVEDHRLGRMVRNNERIKLGKVFEPADDSKNIWASLHLNLVLWLELIGKIIAIALPFGLYYYFSSYIMNLAFHEFGIIYFIVVYVPTFIGCIILLIYIIKYLINCLVTPFLIEATDTKRVSDIIEKARELKERGGLGIVIKNLLLTTFLQLLMLAGLVLIVLATKLLNIIFIDDFTWFVYFALGLILSLVFLRYSPVFTLTRRIINELLFEDLYISNSRVDNIKVEPKVLKAFDNKINKNNVKENILKLFDEQVPLDKFIEPKKDESPKDIEVLKDKEETKDFFDDSMLTNETESHESIKAQKNSFQEILLSDKDKKIDSDQLSSIDDLLKSKEEPKEEVKEEIDIPETKEIKEETKEVKEEVVSEEVKTDEFFNEENKVEEKPKKRTRKTVKKEENE